VTSIAAKIGCTAQSLNEWVKKAEIDSETRVSGESSSARDCSAPAGTARPILRQDLADLQWRRGGQRYAFVQTRIAQTYDFRSFGRLASLVAHSFPAHHSWGLVFACQSAARSRQVLETGARMWRRKRPGRFCLPQWGSRQKKQSPRFVIAGSKSLHCCGEPVCRSTISR
jgi:hypothetical protein